MSAAAQVDMPSLRVLLLEAFSRRKFGVKSEEDLQNQVEQVLRDSGLRFKRECSLNEQDRVDFYVEGHKVAIEVKIEGGLYGILAQLKRYADSPFVDEVILLCLRPLRLPATLSEKPVWCVPVYTCLI
jgi:hypothetical protein